MLNIWHLTNGEAQQLRDYDRKYPLSTAPRPDRSPRNTGRPAPARLRSRRPGSNTSGKTPRRTGNHTPPSPAPWPDPPATRRPECTVRCPDGPRSPAPPYAAPGSPSRTTAGGTAAAGMRGGSSHYKDNEKNVRTKWRVLISLKYSR